MASERLQKVLARAGVASRRASEELIRAGRVRVDGRVVAELGVQVEERARIEVDGRRVEREKLAYVVLHKPRGVMTTLSDPEGRPTVRDYLRGVGVRVVPVGRLDFHTSGALLCTNDGDFAAKLMHPRAQVPKVYVAKVGGVVDDRGVARLSESIWIDGRPTTPAEVRRLRVEGDKTWLEVTLREGRNRQVRRLGDQAGLPVMRLARLSHAGIDTEGLRPGQWRHLGEKELLALRERFGVPRKVKLTAPEPISAPSPRPSATKARRRPGPPSLKGPAASGGRSRPLAESSRRGRTRRS